MKQEVIISNVQYNDPEHEAALNIIKDRLISTVELQGKQDGPQNKPKTIDEHCALILNLIEVTLQGGIDRNQQKYLPVSGVAAAKLAEMEADKKEQELQVAIDDEEHALPDAINDAKRLQPDVKLIKIRRWVFAGLVFIALTEGYLSYPAFRHVSFPIIASIIASIAIAFGVGITSHHLGGYIKNAQTRAQVIRRYLISLVPAIIGFSVLGVMRANAYNHTSHLQVGSQNVTSQSSSSASAVAIAIISILLYWVALFLSSKFFRTKAERLQEHAYEEKCNALEALQKSIQDKKDEIVRVRYEKVAKMALAAKRFEYALYQERQLINFAQNAAEAYKQKNLRHRKDGCPAFFSHKPIFHFTTFFDSIKTQKYETVY
jgi:hypothetical protein